MKDIEIEISRKNSFVDLPTYTLAVGGENLQGNLVFSFNDEFVNGQARLELTIDGQDSWIPLLKNEETYYCPIKSAITKEGKIGMQLVITENETEDGIPIFKSNKFDLWVEGSINAEIEQPEEYPTWIEIANEKLNEMDNLDIEATKEDDTTTIIITKKDGTEESVEVKDGADGERGPRGETGPAGQDGKNGADGKDAKINGVNTLNIQAGQNINISQSGSTMKISSTGGGGGASEYVVRLTKENDEITSDKTISEIITAYNNGNIVKGVLTDTEIGVDFNLQLLIAFEDSEFGLVQFATVYDSGDDFKSITIIGTLENNEDSWQYLDKEIVSDSDYVHTDNNYTTNEKNKLAGLENKIITVNADPQTMIFDKSADEINEYLNNGYIVMALGYQVFRNDYDADTHTIKLAIFFGSFGQVITVTGNQITGVDEYFYASDANYIHTDNNFTTYYKDKLDNMSDGNTFYLGKIRDYTQQDPLDLDKLEAGLYVFDVPNVSTNLYLKGTNNNNLFNGSYYLSFPSGMRNIIYLKVDKKFSDLQLSSSATYYATLSFETVNTSDKSITNNFIYLRFYISNGNIVLTSTGGPTTFELVTKDGSQTIYGAKTFSTLPQSSVVPTNDNDLANKKYVDDSIASAITTTLNGSY